MAKTTTLLKRQNATVVLDKKNKNDSIVVVNVGNDIYPVFDDKVLKKIGTIVRQAVRRVNKTIPVVELNHTVVIHTVKVK